MASPLVTSVDWGDVTTTTLESRSRVLGDNITNNNALLSVLKQKGKQKPFTGGREIFQELRYAQNQTFMWYSGTEFLNISLNETMTGARFPIKQASIAVVLSGLEQIQNAGDEQMIDLIEARVDTAEDTFWNQMSAAVYSDGTGFGGKQLNGLALLVSKAPTSGIVGGLDRSQQVWWRNSAINANTDTRGVVSATNIQSYMNSMTLGLKRNSDGVDMIVFDTNYYGFYLASLQAQQRITTAPSSKAGAGFTSLKYYGAGKEVDVYLDGGKNGQIPVNTGYFINSDYLFYRPSAKRNFVVIGGDRTPTNQDAIVRLMAWAGNITANNLSLQGVLWQ
ncbi:phage major capsid protein [Bradyrhizobium sp. UFLA03-84]|uniref:phage major capsid protein n=1 Tax=Bradyrhizobium sp. UFLA03-84 TaxID=418599 RepID=UPI000BADD7B7|nr:phage major capsid protein [Bradyrhizobium sp. UFLA03-84]PAY07182.1 phage major capsid protein [Bradyrhizobium sp. UFLA03-84]